MSGAVKTSVIAAIPALGLEQSYAALPESFHALVAPSPVRAAKLVRLNGPLAEKLGLELDGVGEQALADLFAGNAAPGNGGRLVAMAYSGHQFGQFNPGLGDGRAALLGEVVTKDGERFDIQLKGSGPTPFSRRGDGRAALGPVIREYVVSEAMHALGIPTTRSLAIATTGEMVIREQIHPGAVLTRVAASHLRIGTFQHFAARGDTESLKTLLDYAIARHYPQLETAKNLPLALLGAVIERQASLIAKWMAVGFIHGVMNTDNMTISGETIDYGPCAFMDHYEHYKVYSSIDQQGRYAYGAQPMIAKWNLTRLAEALLVLADGGQEAAAEAAVKVLDGFDTAFAGYWLEAMGAKLGLTAPAETDRPLILDFLTVLHKAGIDFTSGFAALETFVAEKGSIVSHTVFEGAEDFEPWLEKWRNRLEAEGKSNAIRDRLRRANPVYIPRNHLVEEAIREAEHSGKFEPMEKLLQAVSKPFERREGFERYALPPQPDEVVHRTFCGT